MSSIELVGLTKRFGDLIAVKDLDLMIEDKEFVAILGPSGCGKTTTMNMIAGIEHPTAGQVLFDGVEVQNVSARRRGVGFVFQNYAIFTHISVYKNLSFGLEVTGVPAGEIERRVADMAKLVRLTHRLEWRSSRLNVNELQRLALGRSAILGPQIFLLDEPLSNLDAAFRAEMRTELKHLQHQLQQTMVYVTHDQLEAMSMADHIAIMDLGVLQQFGTPLEVYNKPANLFVANFMGSPSMNLCLAGSPTRAARSYSISAPAGGSWSKTNPCSPCARRRRGRTWSMAFGRRTLRSAGAKKRAADCRSASTSWSELGPARSCILEKRITRSRCWRATNRRRRLGKPWMPLLMRGRAIYSTLRRASRSGERYLKWPNLNSPA